MDGIAFSWPWKAGAALLPWAAYGGMLLAAAGDEGSAVSAMAICTVNAGGFALLLGFGIGDVARALLGSVAGVLVATSAAPLAFGIPEVRELSISMATQIVSLPFICGSMPFRFTLNGVANAMSVGLISSALFLLASLAGLVPLYAVCVILFPDGDLSIPIDLFAFSVANLVALQFIFRRAVRTEPNVRGGVGWYVMT